MCTLTIRRQGGNVLTTMSRDEKKARSSEIPPHQWKNYNIFAPQDTQAGGTWAGVNDNRQMAFLLNGYEQKANAQAVESRGNIIPKVLSSDNCVSAIESLNFERYNSFHLIIVDGMQVYLNSWDGDNFNAQQLPNQDWLFFTSSSWEQKKVKETRQNIFMEWVDEKPEFIGELPSIHLQKNSDCLASSVLMHRQDACTKSIVQFLMAEQALARYWPNPHDEMHNYEEMKLF